MRDPLKAMILAAGRGERMRPLTDEVPKPLLDVGGRPLIHWHMEALARAGVEDVVVNVSWLSGSIVAALGNGSRWGLHVHYSREGHPPLETGGGIRKALTILGDRPFLVINGDVWTDLDLRQIEIPDASFAHLVMVPNPDHNPDGDFHLGAGRLTTGEGGAGERLTFSGIGIYRAELFDGCQPGRFPLAPLLTRAMADERVTGQRFDGDWRDVGTVDRLQALRRYLRRRRSRVR